MVEITDGDYRVYISNESLLIQHVQYEKILRIEKHSINITEVSPDILRNLKSSILMKPHAILGIMEIEKINFLIFVKAAYFIGKMEEAEVYRIKEIETVPILPFEKIENLSSEIKSLIVGIKNLLTLGFYYSFNYDLTNTAQKLGKLKGMDILSSANKKFFWNYSLYKKFYTKNDMRLEHSQSARFVFPNAENLGDKHNKINYSNNTNNYYSSEKFSDNSQTYNRNIAVEFSTNKKIVDTDEYITGQKKSKSVQKTKSGKDIIQINPEDQEICLNKKNSNETLDPIDIKYFNNIKIQNENLKNFNNEHRNEDFSKSFLNFKNLNGDHCLLNYDSNNINISHRNSTADANNHNNDSNKYNLNNTENKSIYIPKVNKIWMVVCIYGYVGIKNIDLDSNKLFLYLISRRSVYHAGTRYLSRGVDDYGHVANFIETEQIIKYQNNLMSFSQLRGSVPIFFEQPGVRAQTQITRSPELTAPAFKKHIEEIKEDFNFIYLINLMTVNKPNENIITENFEKQIKINKLKNCKYLFWDFQTQCKSDSYENLEIFVNNLEGVFTIFKYYQENVLTGEKLKGQLGIIRTNCLDCLDRTNVVQARIGWKVLEYQDIWSENGDSISFQYAGSASCITSVTKNGKFGVFGLFQHGLVSITRFYQGNFEDSFKQKCINLLLQKSLKKHKTEAYEEDEVFFCHNSHLKCLSPNNVNVNENKYNNCDINFDTSNQGNIPIINSAIKNQLNDFLLKNNHYIDQNSTKTTLSELTIFIGSWNVAGKEFPEDFSLIKWLYPDANSELPDIYVIGLQEICNLNAKNIMLSSYNTSRVDLWKSIVVNNLTQLGKYVIIKSLNLVGIFVIVFIKENLCEHLTNIDTTILRTGLLGKLGNKGSCIIRFNIQNLSFAFCCSHLKAGSSNVSSRIGEISDIINKNFTIKNYKEMKFREHDIRFIFGDLNFRIDLDLEKCLELIKEGYIDKLYLYDQLYSKKNINADLIELDELNLKFPPTYKYQINSNAYDLKDKRVPSWCDRILFNKSEKIKGLEYDYIEYFNESDHKPVYGIYKINFVDNLESNSNNNFSPNKNNFYDHHINNKNFMGKTTTEKIQENMQQKFRDITSNNIINNQGSGNLNTFPQNLNYHLFNRNSHFSTFQTPNNNSIYYNQSNNIVSSQKFYNSNFSLHSDALANVNNDANNGNKIDSYTNVTNYPDLNEIEHPTIDVNKKA